MSSTQLLPNPNSTSNINRSNGKSTTTTNINTNYDKWINNQPITTPKKPTGAHSTCRLYKKDQIPSKPPTCPDSNNEVSTSILLSNKEKSMTAIHTNPIPMPIQIPIDTIQDPIIKPSVINIPNIPVIPTIPSVIPVIPLNSTKSNKRTSKRRSLLIINKPNIDSSNTNITQFKERRYSNKDHFLCLSPFKQRRRNRIDLSAIERNNKGTVIEHIKDSSSSSISDSDLNSSFSQIESQLVIKRVFRLIRDQEDDQRKLNASYSYDDIDFKDPEYINSLKLCKRAIGGIKDKYTAMTETMQCNKETLLDQSLKEVKNIILMSKQKEIKQNYLRELKSYIDYASDDQTINAFIPNVANDYNYNYYNDFPMINNNLKDTFLLKYFDIHRDLTNEFLKRGKSYKKLSIKSMKSNMFLRTTLSRLAFAKVDNLLYVNYFIAKDISDIAVSYDAMNGNYNNTSHNNTSNSHSHSQGKGRHNGFEYQRSSTLISSEKGSFRRKNKCKFTMRIVPLKSQMGTIQNDNGLGSFVNQSLSRRIIMYNGNGNNNANPYKDNDNDTLNDTNNNSHSKHLKRYKTLFSTQNKDITMIQTNEIKNRCIKLIGDNINAQIIYHIKDCNLIHLKELLSKNNMGLDVNYQDKNGNTFLIYAIQSNSFPICQLLLSKGSNPNICNKLNLSPLHYALSIKDFRIANLLLSNGANENILNIEGKNPWETLGVSLEFE